MHGLLKRQIRRLFGDVPALPISLRPLLDTVSATYEQNDTDRRMLEHSLEVVSEEMGEQNRMLSEELRERRAAESKLEQSLSILNATLDSTGDGILVLDSDRRVESHNSKFVAMWNIPRALVDRRDERMLQAFIADQLVDATRMTHLVEKIFNSDGEDLVLLEFKDGRVFELYSQPRRIDGRSVGSVWSFRDISDRHSAQKKLTYLANYDGLTGLANRNLLMDRLHQAIATAHRHHNFFAVMFIDLDQFKIVNDSLGHSAGDELLKAVADRLSDSVRESDTVARSGGDEFVLIVNDLVEGDAANRPMHEELLAAAYLRIIDTAQRILGNVSRALVLAEQELNVSCSIGISLYPRDGQDADTLLKNADIAMYLAKEQGRNNFQIFAAGLDTGMDERLKLQGLLRHALERNEFELHYQPKVDFKSGRISGVEALLRWNSPVAGKVPPDRFIPLLEETGMIVDVGKWVINEAAAEYERWRKLDRAAPRIAVNVSQIQLRHSQFVAMMREIRARSPKDAPGLDLEITESLIMTDIEINIPKLHAVKEMGFGIVIDDFGTGYSSLSYLTKLPVNSLKIDRAFITQMTAGADDLAIVTATISLAHSLDLKVVAEGVETREQADMLRRLGCDEMQGYLISRALPAEDFLEWRREYSFYSDGNEYQDFCV